MRTIIISFLLLCLHAEGWTESQNTLFVSLGSHCNVASVLRNCKLRHAAFPFDWMTSFDGDGLIEAMRDDFLGLFETDSFSPVVLSHRLRNNRYCFEFPHDGCFSEESYKEDFDRFKSKYQNRVNRFKQLNDCGRKVYFIREAILGNYDEFEPYPFSEKCRKISDEFAICLYREIQIKFPALDAYLIIINHEDGPVFEFNKVIDERIFFIKTNPKLDDEELTLEYRIFFNCLINCLKL